ncbi:MAG TPA: DCC1-like thiol-disulfide oxidoreductase family protein [Bryobacteraceae bacterium]|nr:DCC1-like thiol-disulfide oxidoreductase family protein [Bryobacteraceae bacterium]
MAPELIFYDGHCGLCHGFVKFALARDREGARFRFAPLQGETVRERVPENARAALPDSVVVLTSDGRLLVRSTAVLHVLRQLGPFWRLLAAVCILTPRAWRDWAYDRVAALRRRLFAPPPDVCPLVPAEWRGRFLP